MKYFKLLNLLSSGFFAALLMCPPVHALDLVNDDTDIFLTNPAITAQRPNVLIVLDNTANWNTAFTNEKNALVSVVNNLGEEFNVGLMMFPETGGGNDSVDGGYLRYSIRQMTSANKTVLATLVNNLDIGADKGNNATPAQNFMEAYRYYAGKASRASHGKLKTDMNGNAGNEAVAAGLTGQHLTDTIGNAQDYVSPINDECQKNYIIFISNVAAN